MHSNIEQQPQVSIGFGMAAFVTILFFFPAYLVTKNLLGGIVGDWLPGFLIGQNIVLGALTGVLLTLVGYFALVQPWLTHTRRLPPARLVLGIAVLGSMFGLLLAFLSPRTTNIPITKQWTFTSTQLTLNAAQAQQIDERLEAAFRAVDADTDTTLMTSTLLLKGALGKYIHAQPTRTPFTLTLDTTAGVVAWHYQTASGNVEQNQLPLPPRHVRALGALVQQGYQP